MHFSALYLYGKPVAEFMKSLDEGEGEPEDQQVFGSQNTIRDILGELRPVNTHLKHRPGHHNEPQDRPGPAEERLCECLKLGEEPFRIDERKTHEEGASQVLFPFAETPFFKAFQEF
ncbi:hypothetical protein ES703_106724 [subsurface metagenome]